MGKRSSTANHLPCLPLCHLTRQGTSCALATEYRGACTVLDFTAGHTGLVMNSEQYTPDMTKNVASNH